MTKQPPPPKHEGAGGRRSRKSSLVNPTEAPPPPPPSYPAATTTTTTTKTTFPLRAGVSIDVEPRPYHFPVMLAVLPPLGSLFIGTTEAWSDAIMLIISGFYLYNLVRVPWEMYQGVHMRLYPLTTVPREKLTPEQRVAIAQMEYHEQWLFALVLASPLCGGVLLLMLQRMLLMHGSRYLTPGMVFLYVLAASIRPLSHLVDRVQARVRILQVDATYPEDSVTQLMAHVTELESQLRDLRMAASTRSDVEEVRDELEHAVESVARALRQYARKNDQNVAGMDAHLETVESRARGVEEWIEMQRMQAAQQSLVVRCVWEPVTVLKEAVGVGKPTGSKGLLGFGSKA